MHYCLVFTSVFCSLFSRWWWKNGFHDHKMRKTLIKILSPNESTVWFRWKKENNNILLYFQRRFIIFIDMFLLSFFCSANACHKTNSYLYCKLRDNKQNKMLHSNIEMYETDLIWFDLPFSRFESGERRFVDFVKSLPFIMDVSCTGPYNRR